MWDVSCSSSTKSKVIMDDEDNYVILVPVKKLLEMIENEWNRVYRIWHLFRVDFPVLKVWSKDQAKYAGFFSTFSHKNRKSCSKRVPKSGPFCVEFASRTLSFLVPEKIIEMVVTRKWSNHQSPTALSRSDLDARRHAQNFWNHQKFLNKRTRWFRDPDPSLNRALDSPLNNSP